MGELKKVSYYFIQIPNKPDSIEIINKIKKKQEKHNNDNNLFLSTHPNSPTSIIFIHSKNLLRTLFILLIRKVKLVEHLFC